MNSHVHMCSKVTHHEGFLWALFDKVGWHKYKLFLVEVSVPFVTITGTQWFLVTLVAVQKLADLGLPNPCCCWQDAAELLAAKSDWGPLYDSAVLNKNQVPVASATYFEVKCHHPSSGARPCLLSASCPATCLVTIPCSITLPVR